MQHQTCINSNQRNGNLHINIDGHFTPNIAAQLTMTIAKVYQGKGNIFIHTEKITDVAPESKYTFTNLLGISGLPQNNIYLTGEKGLKFCHDAGKVIVRKTKKHGIGGCGKCKNCSCQKKGLHEKV